MDSNYKDNSSIKDIDLIVKDGELKACILPADHPWYNPSSIMPVSADSPTEDIIASMMEGRDEVYAYSSVTEYIKEHT